MIEIGQHWEFVVAAYLGSLVLVVALVGWTAIEARRARARAAVLEAARDLQRAARN